VGFRRENNPFGLDEMDLLLGCSNFSSSLKVCHRRSLIIGFLPVSKLVEFNRGALLFRRLPFNKRKAHSPNDYEHFCGQLLSHPGWEVDVTSASKDQARTSSHAKAVRSPRFK
jgi:hypothetical protein